MQNKTKAPINTEDLLKRDSFSFVNLKEVLSKTKPKQFKWFTQDSETVCEFTVGKKKDAHTLVEALNLKLSEYFLIANVSDSSSQLIRVFKIINWDIDRDLETCDAVIASCEKYKDFKSKKFQDFVTKNETHISKLNVKLKKVERGIEKFCIKNNVSFAELGLQWENSAGEEKADTVLDLRSHLSSIKCGEESHISMYWYGWDNVATKKDVANLQDDSVWKHSKHLKDLLLDVFGVCVFKVYQSKDVNHSLKDILNGVEGARIYSEATIEIHLDFLRFQTTFGKKLPKKTYAH